MENNKNKFKKNVLKKLTAYELLFDRLQKHGDYIVVRAFIIELKFDFYDQKSIVEKSLNDWKDLHPLLRCNIVNDPNDQFKAYFTYVPNEKLYKNDNIQFLHYKNVDSNEDENGESWRLLIERELALPFVSENELLWRLKFLKLNYDKTNETYKYCILMTNHHAITDGQNAYEIIIELLEIIENNYNGKPTEIDINRKASLLYEYNYPNDPRVVECSLEGLDESQFSNDCFKAPNFQNMNSTNENKQLDKNNGIFYTMDGNVFTKAQDIMNSRTNFYTGMKTFNIDKNILSKLLSKCKKNDVKLTNCLDLIIAFALRQVYKRYSTDMSQLVPIRNNLVINMRRFMQPQVDIRVMGLFLTSTALVYDKELELYVDENNFWNNRFWEIARNKYDELYNHLNSKKFLEKERTTWIENFYLYSIKKLSTLPDTKSETLSEQYILSNIGPVVLSPNNSKLFKIKEYYSALSFSKFNYFECSYCSMCTIDNCLYMCIAYNNCHFSDQVIDYWIQCINDNISKLVQ